MRSSLRSRVKIIQITQNIFLNILRCFDDHQMWPHNWPHYVWASLCQVLFMNILHSPAVWLFDIWKIIGHSLKYFLGLLNVFSECIYFPAPPLDTTTTKPPTTPLLYFPHHPYKSSPLNLSHTLVGKNMIFGENI